MYVVHVTHMLNWKRELFIEAWSYLRSHGSVAKFEVYLGIATAARALRAELEDIQMQLCHRALSPCLCGVHCRSLEVGS